MLSLPDFNEKKILFIFPHKDFENQLKFGNSNLKLYRDGKCVNQISLHILISVFIIGEFTATSHLIRRFRENGISLFLLNGSFKHYATIHSEAEGNSELRHIQYTLTKKKQLEFAKILIENKVRNQYNLLKSYKKTTDKFDIEKVTEKINDTKSDESLLGIEGNVASTYFNQAFKNLEWRRRAPTTKEDIPNMLLDIGYSLLFNMTDSLLRLFGFDTYKGFYHKLYFQRKSLSCDIMEPMRVLVDKSLIKAYNLNQIDEKDFIFKQGHFQFKNWDVQRKYADIFTSMIIKNKDSFYSYILDWYRYYHNQEKYSPPNFTFNS